MDSTLISGPDSGNMDLKVNDPQREWHFPALCIAIGLLLGVPPIVVGYEVVRRRNSRGPETPLNRADARLWLVGADQTKHPYFPSIQRFDVHSVTRYAMAAHRYTYWP